ncbi:serine acetyltransferase [Polaromonas sp.]|jgi:serine O-acetyltransferase|uniref:serine O-acetyltransferase n=1 Tax=Polaromonas sp. TaxID=1869339 RepID=UPI001DCC3D23|nr:serine acetyltransferase [Polaromonas sp.]MBT9475500.1 serine acetyltransferase [Polaromonas sp.]
MTFDAKMIKVEDFNLLSYLAADLRRAQVVLHGTSDGVSGLRLWLGAFSPRFVPVLLCRLAYCLYRLKLGPVAKVVSMLNFFLFGIEIAVRCPIGKGLFLPHTQGTVIGAWSIGENVTIFQGVTLGAKEVDFSYLESSRPTVGDGVTIGSGAKVLGGLTLGSGSRVGANAVVLNDVAPGLLAVGIPAKVVDKKPSDHAT